MKTAVVAGTLALDQIPIFPNQADSLQNLLPQGRTLYLDGMKFQLGGCVGNTGLAMHRLGAKTVLLSKVGSDPLGTIIREMLEAESASARILTSDCLPTTATIVIVPEGMERVFWHLRGASQDYDENEIVNALPKDCDVFHFGYPTGMQCMHVEQGKNLADMFRKVKERGITTSLDMSLPTVGSKTASLNWRAILEKTLPYVDLFLPSFEEIVFMLSKEYYLKIVAESGSCSTIHNMDLRILDAISEEVLGLGVKVFVVKLGPRGLYLRTSGQDALKDIGLLGEGLRMDEWRNRELLEEAFDVEHIVSTSGAGDTVIAGILAGMMQSMSPESCMRLASGAAAVRIGSHDGIAAIGNAESVMKRAESLEKCNAKYPAERWSWNQDKRNYTGSYNGVERNNK